MQELAILRLKKNEDRRICAGHVWIYSNEIDTAISPLKQFTPGQEVCVESHNKMILGVAYINPHSLITARLFSRHRHDRLNLPFFTQRIQAALRLRERLYPKPFYRLIYSESDGLPGLIVDRFDETLVVQINTVGMEAKKSILIDALREVLPNTTAILCRNDSTTRQLEGLTNEVYAGFGIPPEKIRLEENEAAFYAPLWQGQKTGWFFDHRLNRSRLADYVKNQRVLDVFSYLGGWGIQAAAFGAQEVYCIDASNLATSFIIENAVLNNVSHKVNVICEDAFLALKNLQQTNSRFDVIIIDPPAFAKKQKDKKAGILAYQRINELALKLLIAEGILISCSCSMHVDNNEFLQSLRRASLKTNCELQILERGHQAPDHPVHAAIAETDYLKMIIARKRVNVNSG